jgi:hypothetical protein
MAQTKRQERRGGFHAFEKRIHEIEEADRAEERERDTRAGGAGAGEPDVPAAEIRPPPAHDE